MVCAPAVTGKEKNLQPESKLALGAGESPKPPPFVQAPTFCCTLSMVKRRQSQPGSDAARAQKVMLPATKAPAYGIPAVPRGPPLAGVASVSDLRAHVPCAPLVGSATQPAAAPAGTVQPAGSAHEGGNESVKAE